MADIGRYPGVTVAQAQSLPVSAAAPTFLPPANNPNFPGAGWAYASTGVVLCPVCSFSASATGNIDNDNTLDSWHVASMDETINGTPCNEATPANGNNPAGQPWNINNDVGC